MTVHTCNVVSALSNTGRALDLRHRTSPSLYPHPLLVKIASALTVTHSTRHRRGVPKVQCRCAEIPAVAGLPGRVRERPGQLHADKGYDYKRGRFHLIWPSIANRIARRGVESSERLSKHRWVVERTHRWVAGFGKLRIRSERRQDIHEALLKLAAAIICARFVDRWCQPL